jgi:hypothetical protein
MEGRLMPTPTELAIIVWSLPVLAYGLLLMLPYPDWRT